MKRERLNKKNFEEKLKAESEDFQLTPSDGIWNNIQKEIPSSGRKIYYMKWAAAAAALLLLVGVGIYFLNENAGVTSIPINSSKGIVKNEEPSLDADRTKESFKAKEDDKTTPSSDGTETDTDTDTQDESPHLNPSRKSDLAQVKAVSMADDRGVDASKSREKVREHKAYLKEEKPELLQKRAPSLVRLAGKVPFKKPKEKKYPLAIQYPDGFIKTQFETNFQQPLLAVNESPKQPHHQKVTFGAHFTPGVSYRTLKPSSSSGDPMMMSAPASPSFQIAGRESAPSSNVGANPGVGAHPDLQHRSNWGWNAGLRMGIPLSDKWIVKTGLALQETAYKIDAYRVVVSDRIQPTRQLLSTVPRQESAMSSTMTRLDNSSSNIPQNKEVNLKNQYLNMGIPILIGYNFGNPEKMNLTVMAGAGLTYMLHSTTVEYTPEMDEYLTHSDKKYLKPFNSNLLFELDLNMPISETMNISVGPTLQYQLTSSYKSGEPVVEFPYLIGFKTALFWW